MFESFGAALGQIFNDPELKAKLKISDIRRRSLPKLLPDASRTRM